MKKHIAQIAIIVQHLKPPQFLPAQIAQATKVHWELVDVVDFYGQEKPSTQETRARTHLEQT